MSNHRPIHTETSSKDDIKISAKRTHYLISDAGFPSGEKNESLPNNMSKNHMNIQ